MILVLTGQTADEQLVANTELLQWTAGKKDKPNFRARESRSIREIKLYV